ncbi:hypothetical protein [Winogradskyella sp.]|uniref:hypothetical protein n=1 Tax=Winogradskyella sp. TaxID=1883156 RepID=UPI00370439DB
MKSFASILFIFCFCIVMQPIVAQSQLIKDRLESSINSVDTIPDYRSKTNKLKLSGTIYKSDGVTPAKNVVLYIEQPNENGDFDLRRSGDERYVFHRSWVKTDNDGKYTIYTFVPGNDRRYNQLQQIFPVIKEPSKEEYQIETFLFNDDPLLTQRCRKRISKKSNPARILNPKEVNGLLVAQHDIVLN